MANITAYKFVNPGLSAKSSPAVKSANQTTLAVNRLGVTVESIAKSIADLGTVAAFKGKLEAKSVINARRQERLRKDEEAERNKEYTKEDEKSDKKVLLDSGKAIGKGAFAWLENFLGPIGSLLLEFAAFSLTSNALKALGDPENAEKIKTFLVKTEFVFTKLKEFADGIFNAIGKGLDFIFGKETTIGERLNAFGKIAMAIGGIAGMIAAAGGLNDLLDAGDSLTDVDGGRRTPKGDTPDKPTKPAKPTPTNPSGANPDFEGPRGRLSASDVKQLYGDAAEKAYKKVLAERGEDAARVFLGELQNNGGSVTKAQQKFNKYVKKGKFPKIEPPKPSLASRVFGGIQDLTKKGLSIVGQGLGNLGKGALEQFNKLSNAGKKAWNNTVAATQALQDKATKWASIQADNFKKGAAALGERAKNALFQKVLEPLRPIIDPIAKKAKQVGELIFENLKKIPGFEKVLDFLKKKGIAGLDAIAGAGSKLGKRAGTIIPIVGGLVNLAFAYDRAANGDSIGALLEGTSGILDIAGLFTGGTTSGVSMLIDGYMFARDFIPQLQEGENAVINRLGVGGFKSQIDTVLDKLPNLGEIIGMITGNNEPKQEMFLGGVVKNIGNAVSGIVNNPIVKSVASVIPGAAPIMAGIGALSGLASGNPMAAITQGLGMIPGVGSLLSSPLGQVGTNLLSGNIGGAVSSGMSLLGVNNPIAAVTGIADRFGLSSLIKTAFGGGDMYSAIRDTAASVGVDPKVLGVADAGQSALSTGGLSERLILQEAVEFLPVPIVITQLKAVPQAVPINNSANNVISGGSSSLTKRMQ
ncbi:hypothetical protein RW03080701_011 [Synechococcus phage S-RIM8]|uniref:Uncharacterized protein n=1 Tax=Synechococcus phage S-RIM8 TaxID=756278 RepID=A0A1D7S918_9CAUD|nr:hypothetical protein RW01021201_011 [Synechococcus phage S-RIM8]AOO10387.1 hypothetical protein RW03080701_011 [Synechococcus phage S-RIM8]AOO10605.1 hypothetical protein RW060613_011 [Synechococcus phage S-RIM8]AOO11272.1 hypothetical protein RW251112_011 [Synechococcus phage S-RIM8]QBQ75345.1 hypothetical protein RW030617_011 [Synechococcus phage S-RIM8]